MGEAALPLDGATHGGVPKAKILKYPAFPYGSDRRCS
jgi:hypothetical protein